MLTLIESIDIARIIYEIIQSVPCPDYIEIICDVFVAMYPLLTAYFMIRFDKRVKSSVYGIFGITIRPLVAVQKREIPLVVAKKVELSE